MPRRLGIAFLTWSAPRGSHPSSSTTTTTSRQDRLQAFLSLLPNPRILAAFSRYLYDLLNVRAFEILNSNAEKGFYGCLERELCFKGRGRKKRQLQRIVNNEGKKRKIPAPLLHFYLHNGYRTHYDNYVIIIDKTNRTRIVTSITGEQVLRISRNKFECS